MPTVALKGIMLKRVRVENVGCGGLFSPSRDDNRYTFLYASTDATQIHNNIISSSAFACSVLTVWVVSRGSHAPSSVSACSRAIVAIYTYLWYVLLPYIIIISDGSRILLRRRVIQCARTYTIHYYRRFQFSLLLQKNVLTSWEQVPTCF